MNTLKQGLRPIALLLLVFFVGMGTGVTIAAQGHMLSARSYLNDALVQLDMALADKAGHRVQAIKLVKALSTR